MSKNNSAVVQQTSSTLVRQPYAITVAKHNFNVHEMRVMTRITEALQQDMVYGKTRSEVQKTLFGDKIIRIPTKLLLRNKDSNNYSAVKRALKSLETKTMKVTGKDKHGTYETIARLIMKSKYYLNNEMVEIQLDRDILPDYLALSSYSRYLVEVSAESSSAYIMRLYQFVSHWKDKTKKVVTIGELRDLLEIGDKYSRPKDLRKHILEPCIKDLKERADVWFEIESAIKSGRSIIGYVFNIYRREDAGKYSSAHEQNLVNMLRVLFNFRDSHIGQVQHILARGELHRHVYDKIEEVKAQLAKGAVKHVQAYVIKALQNEFGGEDTGKHNSAHERDLVHMLRTLFGFRDSHIGQVQHILARGELHQHVCAKIEEIKGQVSEEDAKHVQAYVIKALEDEFGSAESYKKEVYTRLPPGTAREPQVPSGANYTGEGGSVRSGPTAIGGLLQQARRLAETKAINHK